MQPRSRDRLKRGLSRVPITALALLREPSPSPGRLFAIAGVDTELIVYDADSGDECRPHRSVPVFTDQPIHGIRIQGETVLVWGSRSVALLSIKTLLSDNAGPPPPPPVARATAPDWICDGAISPFSDGAAVLATAHNEVVPLRRSPSGDIILGAAVSLSRPMLFTARLVWETASSVLVAGGTVFGHVVVWRCRPGQDQDSTADFLYDLQGFEGSIFGLDISPPMAVTSAGTPVRLLAGCSDDRTVRVWDISEQSGEARARQVLDRDIDTGFGGNSGHDVGAAGTSPTPVAVAIGHASRIWGVRFGALRDAGSLSVYSFGEDAVAQRWLLRLSGPARVTGALSPERAYSLHHGKHLWSSAILIEDRFGTSIATGGADSQVNLIRERQESSCSAILDVHDLLASVAAPGLTSPAAAGEIIGRYDFVTHDRLLTTTSQGRVLLGSLAMDGGGPQWRQIDVDGAIADELRSCYVVRTIASGSALLGTTRGGIYLFQLSTNTMRYVTSLSGKIVDICPLSAESQGVDAVVELIAFLHGQADPHYLTVDPVAGSLQSQEQVEGLDPRFVPTSAAIINGMIVLGSRHGWLSILERDQGQTYRPVLSLATPSFDTITAIHALPRKETGQKASPYMLVTSKDGKYRIYEMERQQSLLHLHLRHETSPPLGPVISGAWFTQAAVPELILYGFRSKAFVIWNETRQEEVATIECGGAHRNFQFWFDRRDVSRYRLAFTKTSKLSLHCSDGKVHRPLRRGVHGREIKALSSNGRYIASGAEDTCIWIWKHDAAMSRDGDGDGAGLVCVATVKTHVTGIQSLCWFEDDYLFSSAGNEEFFVWRVRQLDSDYQGLAVVCEGVLADKSPDGDLRITHFDVCRPCDGGLALVVTMALSNSTLRTYRYTPDGGGFHLVARGSYTGACLTQTRHLGGVRRGAWEVLAASTDGHVTLWHAEAGEGQVAEYVLGQGLRVHQSSIKSLDVLAVAGGHVVFTGGDDNGVGVVCVRGADASRPRRLMSSRGVVRKGHAAAVTGVVLMRRTGSEEVIGVSVGNDQRVKAWSIPVRGADGSSQGPAQLLGEACSGVADVGDIAVVEKSADERQATLVIGGVGIETWTLSLE